MAEDGIKHDYHLVDPSPWPLVGALGVFVMAVGAVFLINRDYAGFGVLAGMPWIFAIGLVLVLATLAGWWRDMVAESVVEGAYTPVVALGFRYGMVLFLAAEVAFFAAWFWAWFDLALPPHAFSLGRWPPENVIPADPWQLPLLATVIVLTSATTVTAAHRAVLTANRKLAVVMLSASAALGIGFVAVMVWQLTHLPFSFGFKSLPLHAFGDPAHAWLAARVGNLGAAYGSVWGMAAGFCTLNAAAGTVFLAVSAGRAWRKHFTPERHFGFEASAWFWYFVALLWLALYAAFSLFGG